MSEMNEFAPDFIELVDDEGNVKQFEIFDVAEFDGEIYYALIPAIEDDDFLNADCEMEILKTVEENGEEILASITDEEEYAKISAFFLQRLAESDEEMYEEWGDDAEDTVSE